jgi:uncharacterized protein (TIGR00255 family)
MTSFGRAEAPLGEGAVAAEIRTVNSRHLDLRIRLPRECSELEPAVRSAASRYFSRGQVDVAVRLPEGGGPTPEVVVDQEVAARYIEAANALREQFGLAERLSVDTLLGLPEVVRVRETDLPVAELSEAILTAVARGCAAAAGMRRREGEALESELSARLSRVEEIVTQIGTCADEVIEGLLDRLRRRVAALAPELSVDPSRLDQEVVFYADRMDITEELVRLRSHLTQFRESLGESGPVGRKLEFLLQELAREVNTVGSKASDGEIPARVVELKTELEKLREQVVNVE